MLQRVIKFLTKNQQKRGNECCLHTHSRRTESILSVISTCVLLTVYQLILVQSKHPPSWYASLSYWYSHQVPSKATQQELRSHSPFSHPIFIPPIFHRYMIWTYYQFITVKSKQHTWRYASQCGRCSHQVWWNQRIDSYNGRCRGHTTDINVRYSPAALY